MKKTLFFIIFIGFLSFFSTGLKAQYSLREPISASQKADDGVVVAYPNPAKDFIIVKAKNENLKIKQVTFFSILGVQVADFAVNMNTAEIRLDKLKSGKYLMKYVLSDNTMKVTQIIKQ